MFKFLSKYIYPNDLLPKLKLYGPVIFIRFSLIEIYRICLRMFFSSYSQFREDLIIEKYLGKNKTISYIDVGSNHPIKFNNTYRFYLKGGHGINVDPNEQLLPLYNQMRPKDINLIMGLGDKPSSLTFYKLWPDSSSSFSSSFVQEKINTGSKLIYKKKVKVTTLQAIISKYFRDKRVDLLSIDTEGFDLKVLQGNDWQLYRPKIVCVENLLDNRINGFMFKVGYRLIHANEVNAIFIDSRDEQSTKASN